MTGRQHRRRRLAQNFLKDKQLVRHLVARSSIGKSDTVYEIGPGRGIITAELGRVSKRVIAIEKDPTLARYLRRRFTAMENIAIVEGDFLDFRIAPGDHKIFASIPYNLTASIVRRLIYVRPYASEAFLVLQKEPAIKFSGSAGETLFSLLAKPYVEFKIMARLSRSDFEPVPAVDSVLLRITRRERALLSTDDARGYRDFVSRGFHGWKPNLKSAFKDVFTYPQWKRLTRKVGIARDATPTQLSFDQWLGLYSGFKEIQRVTSRPRR